MTGSMVSTARPQVPDPSSDPTPRRARLVFRASPRCRTSAPSAAAALVTASGWVPGRQASCRVMTSALSRWHASSTSKGAPPPVRPPCRFRLASVMGLAWCVLAPDSSSVTALSCPVPAGGGGNAGGHRPPRCGGRPVASRWNCYESDVVVHRELVRRRAQPHRVEFVGPLVLDPGLDEVRGEYPALEQVVVVLLERVEH